MIDGRSKMAVNYNGLGRFLDINERDPACPPNRRRGGAVWWRSLSRQIPRYRFNFVWASSLVMSPETASIIWSGEKKRFMKGYEILSCDLVQGSNRGSLPLRSPRYISFRYWRKASSSGLSEILLSSSILRFFAICNFPCSKTGSFNIWVNISSALSRSFVRTEKVKRVYSSWTLHLMSAAIKARVSSIWFPSY